MRSAFLLLLLSMAVPAGAQTPARASTSLVIEVVDSTGGFLPAAAVTVKGANGTAINALANDSGQVTVTVPPGSYELAVSADSFEPRSQTVQVTAGRPRRLTVELALLNFVETVTVSGGERTGPAETTVGADEIAALADDPEALTEFIQDVGGAAADVRVDGFAGGRMPPKEQVAQIVVMSDPYSAQFHGVGQNQVNVITRPGFGEWQRSINLNFGNDALAARNPFAREKLPFRNLNGGMSFSGPIKRLKTSVSMDLRLTRYNELVPTIAQTPSGFTRGESHTDNRRQSFEIRFTNALGKNAILRNRVEVETGERAGAGVGELDLPERAYSSSNRRVNVRSGITNKLRHGIDQEIRAFGSWQTDTQQSLTEALGINVLGAFRAGGAQVRGERTTVNGQFEGNWTFPARGRHSFRAGTILETVHIDSSNVSNYLGTFVFSSLDAFAAGAPLTYTQRIGSLDIAIHDFHGGLYAQDEIRLAKTLQLGLGVREEWQPAIDDGLSLAPRVSLAYVSKTKTTLRVGFGQFYSWHDTSVLEEARRLTGVGFQEIVLQNPSYPNPFVTDTGVSLPSIPGTRLVTSSDLVMPKNWRASVTFEKKFGPVNLRTTANRQIGQDEARSRNINAPINGIRPDGSHGNVLLLSSSGGSRRIGLDVNLNAGSLWHRRLFTSFQYSLNQSLNDADGALSLPADSRHPELEWGPSRGDVRHRANGSANLRFPPSLNASLSVRWQSASPYNITTGLDTNGDLTTNDRPDGIGRNAARGVGSWAADLRLGWTRPLRTKKPARPRPGQQAAPGGNQGKEAGVTFAAHNLLNTTQFGGFNGVMTSPLFGHPVSAFNPRRMDVSMHLRF